jgi:hypothetical protein
MAPELEERSTSAPVEATPETTPGEAPGKIEAAQAEITEAEADLQKAQTLVSDLLEKAKRGEKVTAAKLAEARAEVDLSEMILQGRCLRIEELKEDNRLQRIQNLESALLSLAGDTSCESAESKMCAALRSYVAAVHQRDAKQGELLNRAGDPTLAPLPDNFDINGTRVAVNHIVLQKTRYQTAISQAVNAAISEFYPRALVRIDTPID